MQFINCEWNENTNKYDVSVQKRLCCVLTTLVWQLLSLTTPFGKGSACVLVLAEWMCQQQWLHPQWLFCFCCVTEHIVLSSENKHFCNVFAWLILDLISIFEETISKNQIFGGWQYFLIVCPLQPWHFSYA